MVRLGLLAVLLAAFLGLWAGLRPFEEARAGEPGVVSVLQERWAELGDLRLAQWKAQREVAVLAQAAAARADARARTASEIAGIQDEIARLRGDTPDASDPKAQAEWRRNLERLQAQLRKLQMDDAGTSPGEGATGDPYARLLHIEEQLARMGVKP